VFHGCVSKNNGAVRLVGASASCHKAVRRGRHRSPGEFAVSWNRRGLQGIQGIPGVPGSPGLKGDQGAVGPTAAAASGTPNPVANPTTSSLDVTTTISAPASGKLFVIGYVQSMHFQCSSGASCVVRAGLYMDGVPVAGSGQEYSCSIAPPCTTASARFETFGLTGTVSAGPHTVSVEAGAVNGTLATSTLAGSQQIGAILVGT
jgi:hypothetical protein